MLRVPLFDFVVTLIISDYLIISCLGDELVHFPTIHGEAIFYLSKIAT